jgi:SAM-dependent methyltransferase
MTDPPDLSFYKEHPKTCDPGDFWGQVKRTVNGKPITQEQIDMIVDAVCNGLELSANDVLLDLCCGNGALTTYFFSRCSGGLGVDFSEYLIEVARSNFVKRPQEVFLLQDVVDFAHTYPEAERFTKAVCYGSLQYLTKHAAYELFMLLRRRFTRLHRLFIGNVPDKKFARSFFGDRYKSGIEDSPAEAIGIWRTHEEFRALAEETGWHMDIRYMPKDFYWAHYRYDVILFPN